MPAKRCIKVVLAIKEEHRVLRTCLEDKYKKILNALGIVESGYGEKINAIIKNELGQFMKTHSKVAIYGGGEHTRMLMADYMYELKSVEYIIDNNSKKDSHEGFKIISEKDLEFYGINGVIISSSTYRKEMVWGIQRDHKTIDYLDLYEKFEEQGIYLNTAFYRYWHPTNHYLEINKLRKEIKNITDNEKRENVYLQLLKKYIEIKDFRMAGLCIERINEIYNRIEYLEIEHQIKELYQMELQASTEIHDNNVLMLCVDGLRRKDYIAGLLPDIKSYCDNNMTFFSNAYSCSTSTYESLIPAFSENDNLGTNYFESNEVDEQECRFIQEAKAQGRKVYFYTDSTTYIRSENFHRNNNYLTATEKFWHFLLDASEEVNGLFYVHILNESHFPYVNPYTENDLIAHGSNIMFDYLMRLGGRVRTDYKCQQHDSLRYLDDTLAPFIRRLAIRFVIFADHGNILVGQDERLDDISAPKFSYHEDLIQIPMLIKSPEQGVHQENSLISLMSLNDIVVSLMRKEEFQLKKNAFIKTERSEIYNPDFQYLYKKVGKEKELMAFEAFIFESGYKLVIYGDGSVKVLLTSDDSEIENLEKKIELINRVQNYITVCEKVIP